MTVDLATLVYFLWLTAFVVGILSAVVTYRWCTRYRRPRVNLTTAVAVLDARTTAVLQALDDLPLGQAYAVLWSILRLIDATAQVATLWPDAAQLSAGAAVARAAARGPTPPSRPHLLPPRQ